MIKLHGGGDDVVGGTSLITITEPSPFRRAFIKLSAYRLLLSARYKLLVCRQVPLLVLIYLPLFNTLKLPHRCRVYYIYVCAV